MKEAKRVFDELIEVVESFTEDNKAEISDVKTWAEYWRSKMDKALEESKQYK